MKPYQLTRSWRIICDDVQFKLQRRYKRGTRYEWRSVGFYTTLPALLRGWAYRHARAVSAKDLPEALLKTVRALEGAIAGLDRHDFGRGDQGSEEDQ